MKEWRYPLPLSKQRSQRVENAERIIMYATPIGVGWETFDAVPAQ